MAFITEDRVKETSTTTGTGDLTLAGAVTGYRAFSAVCTTNDLVPYAIDGGAEWETGLGTYSAANTLTRTTVFESSNAGVAVNFSAGTKTVMIAYLGRFMGPHLIASQATTSGTSVSFTSIPQYYKGLLFEFLGLSHDDGTSRAFRVEFSGDNGSTWSTASPLGSGVAASTTLYGNMSIVKYTADAGVAPWGLDNLASDLTVGTTYSGRTWRIAGGIDAVRFSFAAGNLDAGSINLWGL